jgi:hypothetical protein
MTMTKPDAGHDPGLVELEVLLAEARAEPPEPSDALMARVLADARAEQGAQMLSPRAAEPERTGLWAQVTQVFGGWRSLGGMAVAVCAGFWLGVSTPALMPGVDSVIYGYETESADDSLPDLTELGWYIEEGLEDAG